MVNLIEVLKILNKESKQKFGLICLNCALDILPEEKLAEFLSIKGIELKENDRNTKMDLIHLVYQFYYNQYLAETGISKGSVTFLDFLGNMILYEDGMIEIKFHFDFISKHELSERFAEYCADIDITTYDVSMESKEIYPMDLFLTKKAKKIILTTESVLVYPGHELKKNYDGILEKISKASKTAHWTVLVTSVYGAVEVGLTKLILDMEKSNTWLYIIDPVHYQIMGIVRGKKNRLDEGIENIVINNLPKQSMRTPSQLGKISKYDFSEKNSYKPEKFQLFYISKDHKIETPMVKTDFVKSGKYSKIFKGLLLISNFSGVSIVSHSSDTKRKTDDMLVSGFLSAIDGFISEIGGSAEGFKEISYQGFKVAMLGGDKIKIALFLSESADKSLKERIVYFHRFFTEKYHNLIEKFENSGRIDIFPKDQIIKFAKLLLSI